MVVDLFPDPRVPHGVDQRLPRPLVFNLVLAFCFYRSQHLPARAQNVRHGNVEFFTSACAIVLYIRGARFIQHSQFLQVRILDKLSCSRRVADPRRRFTLG